MSEPLPGRVPTKAAQMAVSYGSRVWLTYATASRAKLTQTDAAWLTQADVDPRGGRGASTLSDYNPSHCIKPRVSSNQQ